VKINIDKAQWIIEGCGARAGFLAHPLYNIHKSKITVFKKVGNFSKNEK
jgi:hypothetical protein